MVLWKRPAQSAARHSKTRLRLSVAVSDALHPGKEKILRPMPSNLAKREITAIYVEFVELDSSLNLLGISGAKSAKPIGSAPNAEYLYLARLQ